MQYNFWTGQKVRLRPVESVDADNFFKYGKDYDDEADRCCDQIHFPRNCEQLKEAVTRWSEAKPKNDEFFLIITDLEDQPVGCINIHHCDRRNGTFQYGLGINRQFRKQGFALDAIKIVLKYMFGELRYNKVNAHVYAFNEASVKLHEKLGFVREGTLRNMIYTDGSFHDEIVFGMTAEEFKALIKQNTD